MGELIRFPDAEALVVQILKVEMATRRPGLSVASKPPGAANSVTKGTFLRVFVSGGLTETMVTTAPLLTIESYAPDEATAYDNCDLALAVIRSQDDEIRGARGFSYPQNLPDPATSQVRFTTTGEIRIWATVTP